MQISPQEVVNGLNQLLSIDPIGVTKMVTASHILNVPYDYADKMIFVCALTSNMEVETGVIGMMNALLTGTGYRLAYEIDVIDGKLSGTVQEFKLISLGE